MLFSIQAEPFVQWPPIGADPLTEKRRDMFLQEHITKELDIHPIELVEGHQSRDCFQGSPRRRIF
jgi:hypothetical protein